MRPRQLFGRAALGMALLGAGCDRHPGAASTARLNAEGTVPPGCVVLADLYPARLGALAASADALMTSPARRHLELAGVDLSRDVRQVTLCQFGATPGNPSAPAFVLLVGGRIPTRLIDTLAAAQSQPMERETIAGLPSLGHDRVWIARRGQPDAGEMVVASDRALLRTTLVGATGEYQHDRESPLSVTMAESQVQRIVAGYTGGATSPFGSVRQIRFSVPVALDELLIRFTVGASPQDLLVAMQPAVTALVKQMMTVGEPAPEVKAGIEGSDVVFHVGLPPGALQALATRIEARNRR